MTTTPDPPDWDQALADLLATEAAPSAGADGGGGRGHGGDGRGAGAGPGDPSEAAGGTAGAVFEPVESAPEVAVLVFGVGDQWLLAALLKGPQLAARTLAAEGMGMAVLDDAAEEAAAEAARTASATLRGQQLLLMRRGESADPAAGDIQASVYLDGREVQRVSPGLVLADSPQLLEDLLIDPDAAAPALAKAVSVAEVSAAEAIGIIGRSVSAARKARRGRRVANHGDQAGTGGSGGSGGFDGPGGPGGLSGAEDPPPDPGPGAPGGTE
ncbi:MAG: hypothetical protein LBC97_07145 [Bifidobacteriaceae bacterium]|nr:hypothetical protein [Bifidobacteriaceae bacterium]